MFKIRVNSEMLRRVLDFYVRELFNRLGNKPLTPAFIELLTRQLNETQTKMRMAEPYNSHWDIEVKLLVDIPTQRYDVDLANPDQIELM